MTRPRLFQRAAAAHAAEVDPASISQWIKRGLPVLDPVRDMAGEGPGVFRLFSTETVLKIAIVGRLSGLGTPLDRACHAAGVFLAPGPDGREAARPFRDGSTYLVVGPNGAAVVPVFPVPTSIHAISVLALVRVVPDLPPSGLYLRVMSRLG